ncbi:HK-domain-containing protein [Glonium stellatum]|uniref:HK-domain-containing protein n=1 Tax=Glonium stellatum TaxID=574774 RepID=A0A8E2JP53_9PEZI|nr:HK-domain-containing protein [Glonium stellatum]
MKLHVDYRLYLVTDSTDAILHGRDLSSGVTVVQYRDKTSDTATLIATAKRLHLICEEQGARLLINDRVDVALAVGCAGVHIGQDDMDVQTARQLLGNDKIIGVTVSSTQQALVAARAGADYLGIGTIYATPTKKDTKSIIGVPGLRTILQFLGNHQLKECQNISTVCIGGINASNVQTVIYQSYAPLMGQNPPKKLDGVAIVSAIMGADDPRRAADRLFNLTNDPPPFASFAAPLIPPEWAKPIHIKQLLESVPMIIKKVSKLNPLCHNMTNLVVQNIAANVALSIGASPIMSTSGDEAAELARTGAGLVINMGTSTAVGIQPYVTALRAYNHEGRPVVLDPVGAGATTPRRTALKTLMAAGYFDLIKGNENEILTVLGAGDTKQRGVDSGPSNKTVHERSKIVAELASRERNVVLMTGKIDFLSDGTRTYTIRNGHPYLGMITGSGCTLGTTIAAFVAAHPEDKLLAALAGILLFEIAAQRAAVRIDVKGPGTFVPAWLDELYLCRKEVLDGQAEWLGAADVLPCIT